VEKAKYPGPDAKEDKIGTPLEDKIGNKIGTDSIYSGAVHRSLRRSLKAEEQRYVLGKTGRAFQI
jgi:ferredoxin-fold anticodon binding domain-containing protein